MLAGLSGMFQGCAEFICLQTHNFIRGCGSSHPAPGVVRFFIPGVHASAFLLWEYTHKHSPSSFFTKLCVKL